MKFWTRKPSRVQQQEQEQPLPAKIKSNVDLAELEIKDIVGQKRVVKPSTFLELVPFDILDCKNSQIFVMNALAQCNIENCSDSFIFIGPTEGSIYIRNCKSNKT